MKKINTILICVVSSICILLILMLVMNIKNTYVLDEIPEIKKEVISESELVHTITKEDYINMMEIELENLSSIENEMIRFIKYKGVYKRYEDKTGIKNDIVENLHKKFTLDEIYLMQRVIETECYQCDFMSKVNVASVILNRLDNRKFGETIEEIITAPNQFAYIRRYITYDTVLALEYASYFGDTTKGALYFHSMNKTETFNGADFIFEDLAGHKFYG